MAETPLSPRNASQKLKTKPATKSSSTDYEASTKLTCSKPTSPNSAFSLSMLLLKPVSTVFLLAAEVTILQVGKFSMNGICGNSAVGLGNVIAISELMVVNDNSIEQVKSELWRVWRGLSEKWSK